MRRSIVPAITIALSLSALAIAHEEKTSGAAATGTAATETKTEGAAAAKHEHKATAMTVQGEIVDLGCYLAHAARGAEHKGCAAKCINGGMPMGLITSTGTLYLLTMSHENADPFNQAKGLAAETVDVTGPMHERNGIKSIEVTAVKAVKAAAAPAAASK